MATITPAHTPFPKLIVKLVVAAFALLSSTAKDGLPGIVMSCPVQVFAEFMNVVRSLVEVGKISTVG